jgi:negative regulator of sigma E activity
VSRAEFSGVDIDLLADYIGGALDGTPDESVVAALIADDPGWRDAHDTLTGAMAAVGTELGHLGAGAVAMPADVVSRVDAAIAELPPLSGPERSEPAARDEAVPGAARRHLHPVPAGVAKDAERERATAPGRRRALRRWAAPIAVAASALAFAGVGLGQLFGDGDSSNDQAATSTAREQSTPMKDSNAPAAAAGAEADHTITASGVDYRRDTLANVPALTFGSTKVQQPPRPQKRASGAPEQTLLNGSTVPALQRLTARAALLGCLDAIAAEHGGGAVAAESIDFARFEGSPALVMRFFAGDGTWAWAGGPDCGAPGSGADTRYQVRVG